MSKKLVTSYTFDASAKTVDAADFTSLEKILLITNVTDQIIIYNFADTTKGGSLTSTTLTLEYDTTTMDDTDKLQILVEDGTVTIPVTQSGTWDEVGINDSGNSITVDGTITANAGTNLNTSALALETGGNLATIAGKDFATQTTLAAINAKLVTGTDIGDVTINNSTGAAAVNIQDGGNTITVDGTITAELSATDNAVLDDIATNQTDASQKTQIVDGSGNVIGATSNALDVNIKSGSSAGTQYTEGDIDASITGTAALVEGAANALAVLTQPLTDTQLRATPVPVSGSITADLGANNDVTVTSGSITATQATGTNLHVVVDSAPTTAVTGTFYQATQPVSGTVTAELSATDNAVLDAIASSTAAIETAVEGTLTVTGGGGGVQYTEADTDSSITGTAILWEDASETLRAVSAAKPLPISDAGGALTVDGTVAVTNAGINTIAGAVAGTEMQVDVLTMPTTTVTASDLDIRNLTNTDVVTAELSATDNAVLDTIAAKDFATQTTLAAINAKLVTGTDIGDVTINNSTGAAAVNIQDGGNSITVDNGGTFAVQAAATLAAETTKVIGTVNVAASQTIGVTQATAGNLNCTEASAAAIKTAVEALDNSVDGNYLNTNLNYAGTDAATGNGTAAGSLRVSLASDSTGIVSLTTSTASIGKLAANSGVDIGDVTLTAGTADIGVVGHNITGVGHGVKTVTTAGTDVALAASTPCKKVDIQAQTDNTSLVAVGGSGVDATVATGTGIILYPGDVYSLEIDNLADIYIDSLVNGEGVRFTYYT